MSKQLFPKWNHKSPL